MAEEIGEGDWFMNLLYWWIWMFLSNIIVRFLGFWAAVFGYNDWGR